MTSLHQDPLSVEGAVPTDRPGGTAGTARARTRRSPAPAGEKAPRTASATRRGKAQRSTADGAEPAASTARAERTAPSGARRPTPRKRPGGQQAATAAPVPADLDTAPAAADLDVRPGAPVAVAFLEPQVDTVEVTEDEAAEVMADVARGGRVLRLLHRRPPSVRRRPALYLAAAIVGALSIGTVTGGDQPAHARTTTASQSVSVAEQLGIQAQPEAAVEAEIEAAAPERLGELAASRSERGAEQAAAAQAQLEADRRAAEAAAEAARPKAVAPVEGARLTSGFGARWGTLHAGVDFAAPMRTPERAVMDGVVLEAGPASGFGLAVYIQHDNGDVTVYGHMDEILVQAGQVVRAGDTIALLGNRGQSTGPHLHFEVHVGGIDGEKVDPVPWLRERGVAV